MLVKQIQFTPMEIVEGLYASYGWEDDGEKSRWGKTVQHSVRWKVKSRGLFTYPIIHIWRTLQLILDSKIN